MPIMTLYHAGFAGFALGCFVGWFARVGWRWYRRRRHRLYYGD
jgi:hypothetical protein